MAERWTTVRKPSLTIGETWEEYLRLSNLSSVVNQESGVILCAEVSHSLGEWEDYAPQVPLTHGFPPLRAQGLAASSPLSH